MHPKVFATFIVMSFLLGALSSGIAGYMGMWISIRTNVRVAAAASSLNAALQTAFRGGAVSGLFAVAMSLLGVGGLFAILSMLAPVGINAETWATKIPFLIVGYGFGASSWPCSPSWAAASTPRPPTSAPTWWARSRPASRGRPAQPGRDRGPRGDNVGDCAGRGADLFESTAAEKSAP